MKKTMFRLTSLMLCVVMLCSVMLGVTAFAAEKRTLPKVKEPEMEAVLSFEAAMGTGEDDDGEYYFTTFEDLKLLSSGTYNQPLAYYYGEVNPLVITESITIPKNLVIYADKLTVAKDVTLTVEGNLTAAEFVVQGTLVNNAVSHAVDKLIVTGSIVNNAELRMDRGLATELTGVENIKHAAGAVLVWNCMFTTVEELTAACAAAEACEDKNWMFAIFNPSDSGALELYLDESLKVSAANIMLSNFAPLTITVAPGAVLEIGTGVSVQEEMRIAGDLKLTTDGYIYIQAPMTVEGQIRNNGAFDIYYDLGGRLNIAGGDYVEEVNGVIFVDSDQKTIPEDVLSGVNVYDFAYLIGYIDEGHFWELYAYTDSDVELDPTASVPMYRMYDKNSSEHFYTGSTKERFDLLNAGWNYEGVGFNFPAAGEPVYRLYHEPTGEHLYTMNLEEKNALLAAGWKEEGVAFNSATESEVPQFRLHNPNASRGAYHFTGSDEEKADLIKAGWEDQGIGWYSCLN